MKQSELFEQMVKFLDELPLGSEVKAEKPSLYHFEAARLLLVGEMLKNCGLKPDEAFQALDFGYLHGLFQEFVHRFFPGAKFTVYDRPDSSIFTDPEYMALIKKRDYLELLPGDIKNFDASTGRYKLILLGEIIEHLNPTDVLELLRRLRKCIADDGVLLITTPNGGGLYNCYEILRERYRVIDPPFPDPIVGMGHIHLWTQPILRRTAEHVGWKPKEVRFYHGREGELFDQIPKFNLLSQPAMRAIKLLADRIPRLRGFFVATYTAN